MDTFTVRDLRERTGELVQDAEQGKLSLVTKHGQPIFLAVPFNETLLELGLRSALAIQLYEEGTLTLGKAAKLAGESLPKFIDSLGKLKIPVVNYSAADLRKELKDFD